MSAFEKRIYSLTSVSSERFKLEGSKFLAKRLYKKMKKFNDESWIFKFLNLPLLSIPVATVLGFAILVINLV